MQVVATRSGVGRLEGDEIALLDSPFPHVGAVLEQTGSLAALRAARVRSRVPLAAVELLCPVGTPRAVWGIGLNYRSKAAATGRAVPTEPILYTAAPSSVVGPAASVTIPVAQTLEMDYEGEIAVVIGSRLHCAAASTVWDCVAGITAGNDLTARDVMRATSTPLLAKSFPGFNPIGSSVASLDELADRDRIGVRTWLNGELVQDDDSNGMIFSIPDLIARISHYAVLEPGDVVLTGTPAGTGQDRGRFLADGDELRVEVDAVVALLTRVAAPVSRGTAAAQLADQPG